MRASSVKKGRAAYARLLEIANKLKAQKIVLAVICRKAFVNLSYLEQLESRAPEEGNTVLLSRLALSAGFFLSLSAASARDLTLAEAESFLVRNNRDLQAARRAVESSDAQRMIAGARPNATFSINSTSIASNVRADTVFRIDQPFERGNKRELRLDAAAGLQRAAQNDSLDVLRQQLATLRSAYFELKQAQERVQVLGESAQLFSGTLAAAQIRLKAGDLAPAD